MNNNKNDQTKLSKRLNFQHSLFVNDFSNISFDAPTQEFSMAKLQSGKHRDTKVYDPRRNASKFQ